MNDLDSTYPIAELLAEAADLSTRAAALARTGEVESALRLEEAADRLRRRARSQARIAGAGAAGARGVAASTREVTISALNELNVPAAPRAVADYTAARFGIQIDGRTLGALRRDEQRSWLSPRTSRPLYVVPALEGHLFLPLRGKVALSSWPIERRLIGPWSERADHLRATINVARHCQWLSETSPDQAVPLLALLGRYALTVTGATGPEPREVEDAATAELRAIEEPDNAWRREAAARARAILDERAQLWGGSAPKAVGGQVG